MSRRPARIAGALLCAALASTSSAAAQTRVAGVVTRGIALPGAAALPISRARVVAIRSGRETTTDLAGRFSLELTGFPDTLAVAALGWQPDTVALDAPPRGELHLALAPLPVPLAELVTTAAPVAAAPVADGWRVPVGAVRAQPAAVEPDLFRALAAVPGVSFSSAISARPLVRGYDASNASVRIDGFPVATPYHIGRAFAAFPADAADEVRLSLGPGGVRQGDALAGTIAIDGRTGGAVPKAGLSASPASSTIWGGGGSSLRWFGAGRAVYLQALELAGDVEIPYGFEDLYAGATFGDVDAAGGAAGRLTLYASRDHLDDAENRVRVHWTNVLLGARTTLPLARGFAIELWGSYSRFANTATNAPARRSNIDLENRFAAASAGGELGYVLGRTSLATGMELTNRRIVNRLLTEPSVDFVPRDVRLTRTELGAWAELVQEIGTASAVLGVRLDEAGGVRLWQPRIRITQPIRRRLSVGISAGRAARTYHLVSDPLADPDLAFYDFWLPAGRPDSAGAVPAPVVDHASADLSFEAGALALRAAAYVSHGRGQVELRPPELYGYGAEGDGQFREGRARARGLELHAAVRGGPDGGRSAAVSYVLSRTERDWGEGWVPWALDRRHRLRFDGRFVMGRWAVTTAVEHASGTPLTASYYTVSRYHPGFDEDGRPRPEGFPILARGPENSGRAPSITRMDAAVTYRAGGPWGSRMEVGLAVLNFAFGNVAPVVLCQTQRYECESVVYRTEAGLTYGRLYDLPAIPTITFRLEF